ncbi:hypothetical protein COMA2_30204 [Candidatus Nitrospira nitrificans]|uniref:Uncharacterized protein n=1 Tax=Candidatus Nitrospira nitrificans TaxID=1742973 RepID=A0A0S4LIB5_9BACT|nr:hypothetical protein COMA2_30204 [Candidatus Nitrospira nitrificans]
MSPAHRVIMPDGRYRSYLSRQAHSIFFMSKDIVHFEWHLTPRGWVRGDWSANEPLHSRVPPPADRLETWVTTETTYDMQFAKADRKWSLAWASAQHSELERRTLRGRIRVLAPESETAKPIPSDFPLN